MLNRLILFALLLFWGAMTWLLWRSEFGARRITGGEVDVGKVWRRVLTAPDDSQLVLRQRRRHLGNCRVTASVTDVANLAVAEGADDAVPESGPEGRVGQIAYYTLKLDGVLNPESGLRPYRFQLGLEIATNHAWRILSLQVRQRPNIWSIEASAIEKTVTISTRDEGGAWEHKFGFDDLKQPDKLLADFGMPWAAGLLGGVLGSTTPDPATLAGALKWEARLESFQMGRSNTKVTAYRLAARLFDRHEAVLWIGRAGEVLRVELPEGILGLNEGLFGY